MIRKFILEEKRKILATSVVLGFFFYFWLEGPFSQFEDILKFDQEETEYSMAKLVGEKNSSNHHGTIEDAETGGYGHRLLLDKKEGNKESGLISSAGHDEHAYRNLKKELLLHSEGIKPDLKKGKILPSSHGYYLHFEEEGILYMESKHLVKGVRGYGGEINVGLFISEEGKILSLHHIGSHETESYLNMIRSTLFYQQFEGMKLKDKVEIDAVSGATLTTEAMARTTTELIHTAMPDPLVDFAQASEVSPFHVVAVLSDWWILHILVIFSMFVYGIQKKWKKSKKGMFLLSLSSVIYIGFFLNNSFTYISFIHPFIGTSVSSLVGLYALFTLLGAVWGKNTYCKYVCPFGNAQRLILRISPKTTRNKFFLSNLWIGRVRDALTLVLIAGVLLGMRSWSNFELFPDLFGLDFSTWYFALAVMAVLFTARYPMIWCRLLCPTGSVLDFVADVSNVKKKDKDS